MSAQGPLLIVEDDEDDQYMIRLALDQLKITNQIRFFANGQEALDYLSVTEEQPFLILCDINMPIMNGIELRKRINENEMLKQKAIPFIFLTTAANPDLVRTAYDATVQGFFKKTTSFDGMHEQLRLITAYWQSCLHPNSSFS